MESRWDKSARDDKSVRDRGARGRLAIIPSNLKRFMLGRETGRGIRKTLSWQDNVGGRKQGANIA